MTTIVELISADESSGKINIQYYLICLPRLTTICEKRLEEGGVFGRLEILECPLLWFPLDVDVISLQRNNLFTDLFLHRDKTSLHDVADSILQLERLTGQIARVVAQGDLSKDVLHLLDNLSSEDVAFKKDSPFSDLIVMDRDVDFISLLLSQLNYEGVLDETFGIECGMFGFGECMKSNGINSCYVTYL